MDSEILFRLLRGAVVTLEIAVLSMIFGTVLSILLGLARIVRFWPVKVLVKVYIEFFRGTSLLVQLFWMFFVLPSFGIFLEPFATGVLAISLNTAAYGAEAVRGAILAIPYSQHQGAIALNMSPAHRMRRIILPQAFTILLPPWGNMLIETLKATSVVSLITITDLTFEAYQLNALTYRSLEIFSLVLIIYFVMAQVIAAGVMALERRSKRGLARGWI